MEQQRDGAMVKAGGNGAPVLRCGACDGAVRQGRGRQINVRDWQAAQKVAHRAADNACLLTMLV